VADHPQNLDGSPPKQVRKVLSVVKPTRLEQRRLVAETWLTEEENSRYRYDVETCSDGKLVYLLRPTWLNKGFDFQINLEGFRSKSKEAPKHEDIFADLRQKKVESAANFRELRGLIEGVYGCGEPDQLLQNYSTLRFSAGLPIDTVLKILKWMFIEQDLTYWNNSGRRMLMGGIRDSD
jgi:hypothetical protein